MPALFNADGRTGTQKTHVLESVEMLACEKIKTGKITAVQHDLIHLLAEMITSQDHYETLCDYLGMPPEYGPMAKPIYKTWMLQTEATLIKFYICSKSYLFRIARLRMAFNACGFLMYCDEVLVSLEHRLSAINDFARVNDPPSEGPSADSCSGLGNDSPRTIRDTRDSAEDSDDEQRQPPNAVASTSKENRKEINKTPPPRDSDTGSPTTVIEYEDMQNDIELTEENVQGIVSLRMERNSIKGETRKEVLERLMPRVELHDINKRKNGKGNFEPK